MIPSIHMVYYRITVFVPLSFIASLREAMKVVYADHSIEHPPFILSTRGSGSRLVTGTGAVGQWEEIEGERIELVAEKKDLKMILATIVTVYPEAESKIEVTELSSWQPYTA